MDENEVNLAADLAVARDTAAWFAAEREEVRRQHAIDVRRMYYWQVEKLALIKRIRDLAQTNAGVDRARGHDERRWLDVIALIDAEVQRVND